MHGLATVALLACRDEQLSGPDSAITPVAVGAHLNGAATFTSNGVLFGGSKELRTYSAPTMVQVSISGTTTLLRNVDCLTTCSPPYHAGDPVFTSSAQGWYGNGGWCQGGAGIIVNGTPYKAGNCLSGLVTTDVTYSWTQIVSGTVTGYQNSAIDYKCYIEGQYPQMDHCQRYDADIDIEVNWVNARLAVSANDSNAAPGQAVTFKARATPDTVAGLAMPLSVSRWRWVPDSGAVSDSLCGTSTVCTFSPSRSGTMYVYGKANQVEDQATLALAVSDTGGNALGLSCTGAVRGGGAVCTATKNNPSAVITSWEFTSPELLGNISETSNSLTWSGTVAVSGTVTVRGNLGGVPASASASLNVAPRNWSSEPIDSEVVPPSPPLTTDPPGDSLHIGWHEGGTYSVGVQPDSGTGPNRGVRFYPRMPIAHLSIVAVNYAAMSVGSQFWLNQDTVKVGLYCLRSDVVPFVPVVERHEGIGMLPDSHAREYYDAVKLVARNGMERLVALSASDLSSEMNSERAVVEGFAAAVSNGLDQTNRVPTYPCRFRY